MPAFSLGGGTESIPSPAGTSPAPAPAVSLGGSQAPAPAPESPAPAPEPAAASFDLGEAHKVAILSVTEGEDKPLKYPDMFHAADVMLLNKTDLLPYLQFDVEACIANARRVNPKIRVIQVSATTGEGMDTWYNWLTATKQLVGLGQ